MIKLHIIDGEPCIREYTRKSDGVERVLAVFTSTKTFLKKTETIFGSLVFDIGTTVEELHELLEVDKDYSDNLQFVDRDEEGFYRIVLK